MSRSKMRKPHERTLISIHRIGILVAVTAADKASLWSDVRVKLLAVVLPQFWRAVAVAKVVFTVVVRVQDVPCLIRY